MDHSNPEKWGFAEYKIFPCGAVAGIRPMTFGKFRIVLCLHDPMISYEDGW